MKNNVIYLLLLVLIYNQATYAQTPIDVVELKDMFDYQPRPVLYDKIEQGRVVAEKELAALASPGKLLHSDKSPIYQQWQPEYIIDKIDYYDKRTVIHFRFETAGRLLSIIYFFEKGIHPWFLRDASGTSEFPMLELRNIRLDGELYAAKLKKDMSLFKFNDSTMNSTCEIHFPVLPDSVHYVHLIEGKRKEKWANHFNAFNIELYLKNTDQRKEKPIEIQMEEQKTELYKLYPNPSHGRIAIEALSEEASGKINVQVFSIDGKLLFTQPNLMVSNAEPQEFELPAYIPNGQYIITILGHGHMSFKLILSR